MNLRFHDDSHEQEYCILYTVYNISVYDCIIKQVKHFVKIV